MRENEHLSKTRNMTGLLGARLILAGLSGVHLLGSAAYAQNTNNPQDRAGATGAILRAGGGTSSGGGGDANAFNNAVDAYNKKDYAQAAKELQGFIKDNPKDAQAHRLMADIFVRQDKIADAIPEWEAAVKLDGNDRVSRENLGAAYLQTQQFDKAALVYKAAYAKKPKDGDTAYYYGLALAQGGHTAEALPVLQNAVTAKPTAPAYMQLGVALDKSGKHAEAAEAFAAAAKLDPKNPQPLLYSGLIYHQTGSDTKAVPALQQALALGTDDPFDAHIALAEAAATAKNTDGALKEFNLAAQAKPDNFNAWANIGILNQNTGKAADAEAAYRKAIALTPPDPKALASVQSNLALLLLPEGKTDEAQTLLAQAIKNDPSNARYSYNQGLAYEKQNKITDAIASYKQALTVDPNLTDAKQNLTRISK